MGNHSKLDRFSTNVSTQTEPGAGLKATGFTAGTQPVAKNMNWLLSETIDKVNDVLEDGTISGFDDSVGMAPIIQRYIPAGDDAGWSQPFDGPNLIEHGAALAWVDLCAHVTSTGVREVLALDGNSSCQVTRFDATTGALNGVSGDLSTGNLPAVGTEDWIPCAMCSDGTTVYITFKDFDATPNETHYVQAFDIATWAVKAGWPGTGTALPGTGTGPVGYIHGDVEIVSATQIATTNSWTTCAVPADAGLSVIGMADGVIDVSGCGDGTAYPIFLTSDGTHIYFTNSSNDINSADIATLAAGKGGDLPYTGGDCGGILFDGTRLHTTWNSTTMLRSFLMGSGVCDFFGSSTTGDIEYLQGLGKTAWDGLCLWARAKIDKNGTAKIGVARIDTGQFCYETNAADIAHVTIEHMVKSIMIIDHDAAISSMYQLAAPMIFDGRDIWVVGDMRDTEALSGNIYRIPKAVLR